MSRERQRTIVDVRTVAVASRTRNYVYVLVETSDGIVGLGEGSLAGHTNAVLGAVKDLEPLLLGADPDRIEHLWQQAYRHAFWHGGVTSLTALAAVEVALWDIKGQALGVPIWQLLGGRVRDKIRVYANGPRGETAEALAASAASLVAKGYTGVKMTPWDAMPTLAPRRMIQDGIDKVRAVREAVGPDVDIMIDAHGRLSPPVAVRASEMLAEIGVLFFEEPTLPTHAPALIRMARKSKVPVAVGERHYSRWGYPEILESRAIGVVQPDIVQSGGIAEARKVAALAEMHFVPVAPHNPWSWVNTVASLHLDAVTSNFLIQEVITEAGDTKDAYVVGAPTLDAEGFLPVPDRPGLGITLDLAACAAYPPVVGRQPSLWHEDGSVADW